MNIYRHRFQNGVHPLDFRKLKLLMDMKKPGRIQEEPA